MIEIIVFGETIFDSFTFGIDGCDVDIDSPVLW